MCKKCKSEQEYGVQLRKILEGRGAIEGGLYDILEHFAAQNEENKKYIEEQIKQMPTPAPSRFAIEELLMLCDGLEKLPKDYTIQPGKLPTGHEYGSISVDEVKDHILQIKNYLVKKTLKPMVFEKRDGGRIKITEEALVKMSLHLQLQNADPEAGGILFGRYIIDSDDIVVDDVSVPSPFDKRDKFHFTPDHEWHTNEIKDRWERSGGTQNPLGSWHTHPAGFLNPSGDDKEGWKYTLENSICDTDSLLFIICGSNGLRIWEGFKSDLSVVELNQVK